MREALTETFPEIFVKTPYGTTRWSLPGVLDFDTQPMPAAWGEVGDAVFETAKVEAEDGDVVHTDRGSRSRRPVIVDALAMAPRLARGEEKVQHPRRRSLPRTSKVTATGAGEEARALATTAPMCRGLIVVVPGR